MLARLAVEGFNPSALVEISAGNFQAWLKHRSVSPRLLRTFLAQTLAERYDANPSAAGLEEVWWLDCCAYLEEKEGTQHKSPFLRATPFVRDSVIDTGHPVAQFTTIPVDARELKSGVGSGL